MIQGDFLEEYEQLKRSMREHKVASDQDLEDLYVLFRLASFSLVFLQYCVSHVAL